MDFKDILRSSSVFSGLDQSLIDKLTICFKKITYKSESQIFKENDKADSLYIIESGKVSISKKTVSGKEKVLAVLGDGSIFGEMAFFADTPRTAHAVTITDVVAWKAIRKEFVEFINREKEAGISIVSGLLKVSMDRLEQTSRELVTIYHTGKIITSGQSVQGVVKDVFDELLPAIPEADSGAIYIYNQFNDEYEPLVCEAKKIDLSPKHPVVVQLKTMQVGMSIEDLSKVVWIKGTGAERAASGIIAPIRKDNKLTGFIFIWNNSKKNAFKQSYTQLVETVASQLVEALENMKYQQEARDRARLSDAKRGISL